MQALYFDGRSSRPRPVELTLSGRRLTGAGGEGEAIDWALEDVFIEALPAGRSRLTTQGVDGRIIVASTEWAAFAGESPLGGKAWREWKLVAVLTAAGVAFALLVFFGIPAAAGPLARMTPPRFEAAMGRNMERQLTVVLRPCDDNSAAQAELDALARVLSSDVDTPFRIRVQVVRAPIINAFALPGGRILVTSRLIEEADGPDELAGVLSHEIAHVERRHVMRAVWRSMGAGLLLDAALGGGTGAGQQAILLAGGVTEQRFSREVEAEADAGAVAILRSKDVSTAGLADFFDRLADKRSSRAAKDVAEWFATHPDTERRAAMLRAAARPGRPSLSREGWAELKQICKAAED